MDLKVVAVKLVHYDKAYTVCFSIRYVFMKYLPNGKLALYVIFARGYGA
jgi:hypothetical protein